MLIKVLWTTKLQRLGISVQAIHEWWRSCRRITAISLW